MISHKECDHPSTPGARAKCRRAAGGATPRSIDFAGVERKRGGRGKADKDDNYGQTPADKSKECVNCGVERIAWRGTDPLSGLLLFVGERCKYLVKRSTDLTAVE